MVYEPPKYPSAIPTIEDLPDRIEFKDWSTAARYNELKKELRAALIELGTLPKGASADVKTRLDAMPPIESPVFTGDVTAPTINLTGGQIKFPAATIPSIDPNTLDDYEEGTWTAELRGVTTRATTPVIVSGYYTKTGNKVTFTVAFWSVDTTGASGAMRVTGLPFVPLNQAAARVSCNVTTYGLSIPNKYIAGLVNPNLTALAFQSPADNAAWADVQITAAATKFLVISGAYFID